MTVCDSGASSSAPAPTSEAPAPNSPASHATGGAFSGVEEFTCEGGWAVVKGRMNDEYLPLLVTAEDGSWAPKEIQEVCQSGELPAKISDAACS